MRRLALVTFTGLWLASCGGTPTTPTETRLPATTATPIGTWETVIDGVIYDSAIGVDAPIVGASVAYDVLHSYFPELQAGRLNRTTTDAQGEFSLSVIVHDTDSVQLLVTAQGYMLHGERLVGVDLLAGRRFSIGLARVATPSATPP